MPVKRKPTRSLTPDSNFGALLQKNFVNNTNIIIFVSTVLVLLPIRTACESFLFYSQLLL